MVKGGVAASAMSGHSASQKSHLGIKTGAPMQRARPGCGAGANPWETVVKKVVDSLYPTAEPEEMRPGQARPPAKQENAIPPGFRLLGNLWRLGEVFQN